MKTLLYFAIGLFAILTFGQDTAQQDIWYNLQTPANEAVVNVGIPDTPFILKNVHGTPSDYTIPVYIDAMRSDKVSDVIVDIIQMAASFDKRGNKMIYLKGKIDLSCCFDGSISIDFLDADDNLVQKARTDADGVFKIKSINGNLFDMKDNKIKFNFTKLKTFDQNADVRFAEVKRLKRPLGSELETVQEKSIVNKNKP